MQKFIPRSWIRIGAALVFAGLTGYAHGEGCAGFLDSLRIAYRGEDPGYLGWSVDSEPCSEAQAQEAFYLQGMGFAALRRQDLAAASWQRALVLNGPWRGKILYQLWRGSQDRGDSLQAEAYAIFLRDDFSALDYRKQLSPDLNSPEPHSEEDDSTHRSKLGFATQDGLLSIHSPSFARDLVMDRAVADWEKVRGRGGIKLSIAAEMDSRLRTGLPEHPDSFFVALPHSGWELFSSGAGARAHYEGWYTNLDAGQLYDFETPAYSGLTPGVTLSKGWAGPTWSVAAGYLGFMDGALDWFGNYELEIAQMRRHWIAYSASSAFSHIGALWSQVSTVTGEWNVIHLSGPLSDLIESPSYDGFESLEFSWEGMRKKGSRCPGWKLNYQWQRDRYTGADPFQLQPVPGLQQELELTGELRCWIRPHSDVLLDAGGGYESNRSTGNSSGPIFHFGAFFRWGD